MNAYILLQIYQNIKFKRIKQRQIWFSLLFYFEPNYFLSIQSQRQRFRSCQYKVNLFLIKSYLFAAETGQELLLHRSNQIFNNSQKFSELIISINSSFFSLLKFKIINNSSLPTLSMILNKYIPLKKLGRGSSGDVILVQDPNKQLFALKKIEKKALKKCPLMEEYLKGQKQCMSKLKSKYVVELYGVEQDCDYIYLVCQYCEGGDLYNHQARQKKKVFSLEDTIKIMAEVLNGLNFLHSRGYIHRDIKLQNILLKKDSNGEYHFKLADFGFTKKIDKIGGTVVGTYSFMSPEIYKSQLYGYEVDMWAFGVSMYFLLNMSYPFQINPHSNNNDKQKQLIKLSQGFSYQRSVKGSLRKITQNCNDHIEDLFKRIFNPNKEKRITFKQIQNHPLFKNCIFEQFRIQIYPSSIICDQQSQQDSGNDIGIGGVLPIIGKRQVNYEEQAGIVKFQTQKIMFLYDILMDLIEKIKFLSFYELLAFKYNVLKYLIVLTKDMLKQWESHLYEQKYPQKRWRQFFLTEKFIEEKSELENFRNTIEVKISEDYVRCFYYIDQINQFNPKLRYILEPEVGQETFQGKFKESYRCSTSFMYEKARQKFIQGNKYAYITLMIVICHSYNHLIKEDSQTFYEIFSEYADSVCRNDIIDLKNLRSWLIKARKEKLKKVILAVLKKYFLPSSA